MMTKMWRGRTIWGCIITMMAFFLFITACSTQNLKEGLTSGSVAGKDKGPSPVYYDFGDVLVPSEMKIDKKTSFIYKTPGFAGGVLSLKGRVEVNSLINFFGRNMDKDNWKLISSFKAPRTIMLFHKGNRWCVINISEKDFSTRAEVWVAPTIDETDEGLLK